MKTLLPYSRQDVTDTDIAAVEEVLRSDYLTTGPQVELFERELAEYLGARHVIAVNSGTAALHLAVLGVFGEPRQWTPAPPLIYVPTLTFVATANAVLYVGLRPELHDVDASTLRVDRSLGIVVDLFGMPCTEGAITDAAHSLGARRDWSRGTYTLSFHPVKTITTGEGGAIVTDDDEAADRMRLSRSHGRADGEMVALGFNYRMSDVAAALGRSQLRRADLYVGRRRELAAQYVDRLRDLIAAGHVALPCIDLARSAWHLFPVLVRDRETRERTRAVLAHAGIQTQVHYPPVHLQRYYRQQFGYEEGAFPVAEDAARRILSLPLWPGMRSHDVDYVTEQLRVLFAKGRKP